MRTRAGASRIRCWSAARRGASLFPFVGTIVYLMLRPPEYLEDVRERELEMQAAEARLRQLDQALCPHCDYRIERDFVRCPSCLRKLKERCANCSRPLDQAWTICPYCEADVPAAAARRAAARRARGDDADRRVRRAELRRQTRGGRLVARRRARTRLATPRDRRRRGREARRHRAAPRRRAGAARPRRRRAPAATRPRPEQLAPLNNEQRTPWTAR